MTRQHTTTLLSSLLLALWGTTPCAQPAPSSAPASSPEGVTMPVRVVQAQRKLDKKVVLVGMQDRFATESWPEAERRATSELRALGFEVVRVPSNAHKLEERLAELGSRAASARALGAVRIVRHGKQRLAQIWLHDALTGKMLLRTIELGTPGSADAGMRVVELIYASLLETQLRDEGRTPPAIQKLVRERLARVRRRSRSQPRPRRALWGLAVAPTLLLSPGEAEAGLALSVELERWLTRRFAVGLTLVSPLAPAGVDSADGAADLQLISVQVGASYTLWRMARFSPSLALGAGALVLRSSGRAKPPHHSDVDWAATVAASAELRLALRVVRGLALELEGGATLALPSLGVHLADERVAVLGRPLMHIALGLRWRWRR